MKKTLDVGCRSGYVPEMVREAVLAEHPNASRITHRYSPTGDRCDAESCPGQSRRGKHLVVEAEFTLDG